MDLGGLTERMIHWLVGIITAIAAHGAGAAPAGAAAKVVAPPGAAAVAPSRVAKAGAIEVQPRGRTRASGFRMEGPAEVAVVFGDSAYYRQRVDRFYAVRSDMRAVRGAFTSNLDTSLALLSQSRHHRCPTAKLAPLYYRVRQEGDRYRGLGEELETDYLAIERLDRYGETVGLTPDYRWKVNRVRTLYHAALVDYREMRAATSAQLDAEAHFHRCRIHELLALGARATPPAAPAAPAAPVAVRARRLLARGRKRAEKTPVVSAPPVTFFIDNRACGDTLAVNVDGKRLGEVPAGAKAAFQSLAGRHALCVVPEAQAQSCGEEGTVRNAYIHDGWSMTLHCAGVGAR